MEYSLFFKFNQMLWFILGIALQLVQHVRVQPEALSSYIAKHTMTIEDRGRWESLDMVLRYTRPVKFQDSLKFHKAMM